MVKKYNKKLVGILLAAVITVTTVMPMQGKAAEEIGRASCRERV